MGNNWNREDLSPEQQKAVDEQLGGKVAEPKKPKRNKYNAVRTEIDGISFDSKLEARYYEKLKGQQLAGEIEYFLWQIPFRLPGGVVYWVDFQVFDNGGKVSYIDTKGHFTQSSKNKIKQTEALYPVKIVIKKKGDF